MERPIRKNTCSSPEGIFICFTPGNGGRDDKWLESGNIWEERSVRIC